jgi:PAS domain S-box-containing protein
MSSMSVRHAAESTRLIDLLFLNAGVGLCLVAPDGIVLRANAEWLRSTGFSPDEALGADIVSLSPGTRDMALALHARARAGHHVDVPRHAQRIDGRETWWEGTIDPIPMEGGAGLLITAREVRGAVGGDPLGDDLGARVRAVAESAPFAVFAKALDGRYVYANPWVAALFGRPREELLGRTVSELLPPGIAARTFERERLTASGDEVWSEDTIPTVTGERTLLTVRFRIRLRDGEPAICGLGFDVTERKRAEEALRESEARARTISANIRDLLVVLDAVRGDGGELVDWRYAEANDGAVELLGLPRDGVIGRSIREVLPDRGASVEPRLRRVLDTGAPEQYERDLQGRVLLVKLFRIGEATVGSAAFDITDRKRAEEALHEANVRKDEFLGILSHELRNPLAPIRNSIYILRHAQPGGAQARRAQEIVERQTGHLTRLVDDLLDVTRIARGKIELRCARVDLREVVRRTAEDLRSALEDRGLVFHVEVAGEKVWIQADSTRMAQVVGNLLNNAAKFTQRGGEVTVSVFAEGADAVIAVTDTGAGIEPSLLPRIFEPFVQGDRTLARTQGGLGLGLALVKGITELHGGTVRVESGGTGKGTTVTLRLPTDANASSIAPAPASRGSSR